MLRSYFNTYFEPPGLFQIVNTFVPDPSSQEPLLVENVPDPLAGEQVSIFSNPAP
jgi:hypothetical protein